MSNRTPIFVVGAPRTGTTLVKEILNRHPDVHLFNELHFFERFWELRSQLGNLETEESLARVLKPIGDRVAFSEKNPELDKALAPDKIREGVERNGGGYRGLLAAVLQEVATSRGAARWGDSSPQDVLYLPTIHEWYPDARIVGLVRDPRGFLASYKNHHKRQAKLGEPVLRRYNPLTTSFLWRSYLTALLNAESQPWGSAVFRLRYEDLVTEPEAVVRGLCSHVGIDYLPEMIEVERSNTSFVDTGGPAKGITPGSRDRWRTELSDTDIWLGQRVCRSVMHSFGYETLADVSPSPIGLAKVAALFPGRLFNLVFRGGKPIKISRLRRVFSSARPGVR